MKKTKFKPVIKWTGSKRTQSEEIVSFFPEDINTYYEPFVGGGSVLMMLMLSDNNVKKYVASDTNEDLISLWKEIKLRPDNVLDSYSNMWDELNVKRSDINERKEYYYHVRERYNRERSPFDFMFLMRTCVHGIPRYNKSGNFNTSFHFSRTGIKPENFKPIIMQWSNLLSKNNVVFKSCPYKDVRSQAGDVLYLDPPYQGTKGLYHGGIDSESLWGWIGTQIGSVFLSYDGKSGHKDNTQDVPKHIYKEHTYIESGKSSLSRMFGKNKDATVLESFYICQ